MECKFCKKKCQKAGRQKNGIQKYYCKYCEKYQQGAYTYNACNAVTMELLPKLVCESVSIRGMARVMKIALSTVVKKLKYIADKIIKPPIPANCKEVELDELRTYIGRKENQYWVAYAICSQTKKPIDFVVGKRSKQTLATIVNTLLLSKVEKIRTDKLNIYRGLIPHNQHISEAYNINHIERNNLNLRTHLKRLSRRTICFSRSVTMLAACLKIYFSFSEGYIYHRI
ncbi:MAG TPA: IS1 family transposase [Chitinophagaceae bacterium]|nr:IS1 family transposase [Chitinophagaceae bacterium]